MSDAVNEGAKHFEFQRSRLLLRHFLYCTILAGSAAPAVAQGKPTPADGVTTPAESTSGPVVDEIIVTAQKRSQNLQDVPISVSVLSGDYIAKGNYRSIQDLSRNQPALNIFPSGRAVRYSLRGVASGTNPALDQSVVTFIDDVYHGKSRTSGAPLMDIDRIEVLRGPQTTFFGNNAIGGAINIQTAKPKKEFGASARALIASQGEYALEGMVNIPVSDTLFIRAAGLTNGLDGYLNDRTGDGWLPHERNSAGRLSALWKPNNEFQLLLKAEASVNKTRGRGTIQIVNCPVSPPFTVPGLFCRGISPTADTVLNNIRDQNKGQFVNLNTQDYEATASNRFGNLTLTSVSAFSRMQFDNVQDNDTTPAPLLGIRQPQRYKQFSQEFRLASDDKDPLSFLAGVYYQGSQYDDLFEVAYSFLPPFAGPFAALQAYRPFGVSINYRQNERVYSAFGSATWHATNALSLSAGGRFTRVHKNFFQTIFLGQAANQYGYITPFPASLAPLAQSFATAARLGTSGSTTLSRTDSKFMPTLTAQYKVAPHIQLYATYTEGFKSGGFTGSLNTGIASQYPFAPESVKAYESGLRSELFDRRLLFNISAFRSNYKNLQVSVNQIIGGAVTSFIQNAASEVSQGIEIESRLAVTRGLSVGTTMSFLDAHYKSYPNAPATAVQRLQPGVATQDLAGKRRIYAPKFAASFYATYKHQFGDGLHLELNADVLHQSSYFLADQDDPFLVSPPYTKIDLRAALATPDWRWELALLAKNVTNKKILSGGFDLNSAGTYVLSLERPRSVALQLSYKY